MENKVLDDNITCEEKMLYGSQVCILKRKDRLNVYKLSDDIGEAILTSYCVFNGVQVVYNDVHMQSVSVDLDVPGSYFELNHCREGRIECEFDNGEYLYMGKDDFVINKKGGKGRQSYFPLSHYHGVSICIEVERAQAEIDKYLTNSKINLKSMLNRLCNNGSFMIMKANEAMSHIFSELYYVPESIKMEYFKLKVLEIILFLSVLPEVKQEQREYYSRKQVDLIKNVQKQIVDNIQHRHTIKELAENNNISLTAMKRCFKGVYGKSIYAYIREYRMKAACELLRDTDDNILDIANAVGYENGSKFSAAFKDVVGIGPKEFRNIRRKCPIGVK